MRGDGLGRYTDIGEKYFDEFSTLFWHRPGNKEMFIIISLFTFIYIFIILYNF